VSVLVEEYVMSINSQNRGTPTMITSIFDVIKQKQQQQYYSPPMPTYLNRFDYFF